MAYTSTGTLLSLPMDKANSVWVPMFEASKHPLCHGKDTFWPVGVTSTHLMAVHCKGETAYPSTLPRPVLTALELTIPLTTVQNTALVATQGSHSRASLLLSQRITASSAQLPFITDGTAGGDVSDVPAATPATFKKQAVALDKLLLKPIMVSVPECASFLLRVADCFVGNTAIPARNEK